MSHTPTSALSASNIYFHPLPPAHSPLPGKESHGRYMLTVPWSRVSGWGQPKISPRADLAFDPLSGVLQYAVTCFEGMKCYKRENGDLTLFRPKANFARLKRSAARLGLPVGFGFEPADDSPSGTRRSSCLYCPNCSLWVRERHPSPSTACH